MSHRRFKDDLPNARPALWLLMSVLLLCGGCASVPKESVELSHTVGQDLEVLHTSYRTLIREYFTSLRREVNGAIDRVFVPAFVNDFVESGGLVGAVEKKRPDLIELWARMAVENIDDERRQRLAPLDAAELELLRAVDESFARVTTANSTITAYLHSTYQVDQVHQEVLESMNLKELRDRINSALVQASDRAKSATDDIEKAAEALRQAGGGGN